MHYGKTYTWSINAHVGILVLESESTVVELAPFHFPLLVCAHVVLTGPHVQVRIGWVQVECYG